MRHPPCPRSVFVAHHWHTRRFDFSMCNPPFYASAEEVARSAVAKTFSPNAVRPLCSCCPKSSPNTPLVGLHGRRSRDDYGWRRGGFREQDGMRESCTRRTLQVCTPVFPSRASLSLPRRWYTSMLGKQSSLIALVSLLRAHSVRIRDRLLSFCS